MRAGGEPGSSGTYTAPTRDAPSMAATPRPGARQVNADALAGRKPAARNTCAKRFASRSSSAYVSASPPPSIAS